MNIIKRIHTTEADQLHGVVADRDLQPGQLVDSINRVGITLSGVAAGRQVPALTRGTVSILAAYLPTVPVGYVGTLYALPRLDPNPMFPGQEEYMRDGTLLLDVPTPFLFGEPNARVIGVIEAWDFTDPYMPRFTLAMGQVMAQAIDLVARDRAEQAIAAANPDAVRLTPAFNFAVAAGTRAKMQFQYAQGPVTLVDLPATPLSPAAPKSGLRLQPGVWMLQWEPDHQGGSAFPYEVFVRYASKDLNYSFDGLVGGYGTGAQVAANAWPYQSMVRVSTGAPPEDPTRFDLMVEVKAPAGGQVQFLDSPAITMVKLGS